MLLQMSLSYSFLWLSSIPLCVSTYHIFFIHPSVYGHFHVLAIINSTAKNIGVHVYFPNRVLSRNPSLDACLCVHIRKIPGLAFETKYHHLQ